MHFMKLRKIKNPNHRKIFDYFKTQSDLARAMGTSRQHVNWWLTGIRKIPTVHALKIEQLTQGQIRAFDLLEKSEQCFMTNIQRL